jgi:choline dehydrogenase-like flavoprotein
MPQGSAERRFRPQDAVDFVIVGSGPAGGSVARELARRGFDVVVLEQGTWYQRGELLHDELEVFFNSHYLNTAPAHVQTYRKTPDEKATPRPYLLYAQVVGGSSLHYAANYWRFRPGDFNEYSRRGGVPGAALADWPVTYEELEPYYTAVEWAVGVSGEGGVDPHEGARSRPYPVPPLEVTGPGVLLEVAAKRMGWRVLPAPMAILSRAYGGRQPCHYCGFCWAFPCEWGAKGTNFSMIPDAVATGRCEVRTRCKAARIETDGHGRVTGVVYVDGDRREVRQRATAVFLCANGAETPRLLLMSSSSRFPQGLANSSGVVGKYLMFNGNTGAGGEFEHEVNGHKGPPVTRIVLDPYEMDASTGLIGGGGFDFRFPFPPILSSLNMPTEGPQWGAEFKRTLRRLYTRSVQCWGHTTSLPVETNRVDLDPEAKDSWGLPAMRVTFREHDHDMRLYRWFYDKGVELLKAAGALRTWGAPPGDEPGVSVHMLGTCRMGNDRETSVVDRFHRAHDVRNLFIADGSSFVTSGRGQPTLTIQALAFRAADHAARLARRGELGA